MSTQILDWNKPIRTVDGCEARLLTICDRYGSSCFLDNYAVLVIKPDGSEYVRMYYPDGRYFQNEASAKDLMNVPATPQAAPPAAPQIAPQSATPAAPPAPAVVPLTGSAPANQGASLGPWWFNIYQGPLGYYIGVPCQTHDEADARAQLTGDSRIACLCLSGCVGDGL